MRDTAEQLEEAEDRLHDSAERFPEPDTAARLHALGDQVTAQAKSIEARAELLEERQPPSRS